jgi:carbohydrate-selective porin OprB
MLELNYNVQMTPWLGVMPNFQYVINPDGLGSSQYPRANEKNAVVFGLQFVIDAAKLLGLSSS